MSSAITKLREALTPDIASSIAAKLHKARADLADAQKLHRTDALEAATGVMGADARLEASVAAVRACAQRIGDLEAAQAEAVVQRQESERKAHAAAHAKRAAAFRKELTASEQDAAEIETLVERLGATWAKLRKHRTDALNSANQSLSGMDGLMFDAFSIARALSVQIDRVNASVDPLDRLPGGVVTNVNSPINPALVAQGFADKLKQANARALALMEGKAAS